MRVGGTGEGTPSRVNTMIKFRGTPLLAGSGKQLLGRGMGCLVHTEEEGEGLRQTRAHTGH